MRPVRRAIGTSIFLALLPLIIGMPASARADGGNLVANGSFEASPDAQAAPADWSAAGNPAIRQRLTADAGREGGRCARLECTLFPGDGPDFHAMICQLGKVAVRRGQWYRLSFWARSSGLKTGDVDVGLSNMENWSDVGLSAAVRPTSRWQKFETLFQAMADVPARSSRLQFWFRSTGSLWLDDVVLEETREGLRWFPQIRLEGVKNAIPNSSFECAGAGWGSLTYGVGGWEGNLFRLEGAVDDHEARHGGHSLRIHLDRRTLPVWWFDYYEPVRAAVTRVLAANRGWFVVQQGAPITLSAYLKADRDNAAALLAVNEAPERLRRKDVRVGTRWTRHEFTVTPSQPYVFIALGLDLEATRADSATLWIDGVQLERGTSATAYEPRRAVESFLDAYVPGNIFIRPDEGGTLVVRAYNDGVREQAVTGRLTAADFADQTILDRPVSMSLPPHSSRGMVFDGIGKHRLGAFRARWASGSAETAGTLRFAIIIPADPKAHDSPFGFNHAYPWDFLVRLAGQAGVRWWRDWSAKWQTVEPERGRWDFSVPDAQVGRVLDLGGNVEVLLPFPSANWSTAAKGDEVSRAAGESRELRTRLPLAFAPHDLNDFGRYAASVARHYQARTPHGVTHFQILNEPVYTDYALPRQFGYSLDDYLRLLEVAHRAVKSAAPECQIVGGLSAGLDSGHTRDFVTKGGLKFVDVFDLHLYDAPRPAETYEEPFRALEALIHSQGVQTPLWITEWGCYADDDPPCVPESVGDPTMNRCRWPGERAATEHLVKFTAVSFAHGVRKIFFHAGTAGRINGPDAGGVLFEYGGSPRTMYAGVAALSRLLGVPEACERVLDQPGLHAYVFRVRDHSVAIAWCEEDHQRRIILSRDCQALDLMGNPLPGPEVVLQPTPIYLVGPRAETLANALNR